MIIKVRTLQGLQKEVNVEPSGTILDLKKKVEEVLPEMESTKQKLIFGGRILEDATLISDTLRENDAVIVMVNRKHNFKKPSTNADVSKCTNTTVNEAASTNVIETPVMSSSTACKENGGKGVYDESVLLTGSQLQETIDNICNMGFEREEVEKAMRNAYNNPSRAIDYLTNRLPDNITIEEEHANTNNNVENEGYEENQEEEKDEEVYQNDEEEGRISNNNIETGDVNLPPDYVLDYITDEQGAQFLSNPNFINFLSNVAIGNPQRISEILEIIERTEPELLQYIRDNQAQITNIIQQFRNAHTRDPDIIGSMDNPFSMDISGDMDEQLTDIMNDERLMRDITEGIDESSITSAIHLTEKELESVNKLEALGFPKHIALEAFIACDKNEELAANYLFENMDQEGA